MHRSHGVTKETSKRNLAMEGLRGFLALTVVFFHVWEMGGRIDLYSKPTDGGFLSLLGVYTVCIFFCISGYLIVQSLILKGNLLHFFRNRAVRIYPVFIVLNILLFSLGPGLRYEWMGQLLGNAKLWLLRFAESSLFLPGVFNIPIGQKNAWSLSYEMAFYLTAAGFYLVLRRWRHAQWPLVLIAMALVIWHPDFIFFAVGYSAYLLETRGMLQQRWLGWISIPALMLGAWIFHVSLILSVLPTMLVFYAVVVQTGAFAAILKEPVLVYLGRISYSLYLIHPFVLDALRRVILHFPLLSRPVMRVCFPLVGIPAAIGASALSYLLIEQYVTRLLLKRTSNDIISKD